jgi:hypothetical protein
MKPWHDQTRLLSNSNARQTDRNIGGRVRLQRL